MRAECEIFRIVTADLAVAGDVARNFSRLRFPPWSSAGPTNRPFVQVFTSSSHSYWREECPEIGPPFLLFRPVNPVVEAPRKCKCPSLRLPKLALPSANTYAHVPRTLRHYERKYSSAERNKEDQCSDGQRRMVSQ